MTEWQLNTPVAFIIFNRPCNTAKVFQAIRQAKPPVLLIAADGPRPDRPDDAKNCTDTRAIVDRVDWPCEVWTNYSDINLGMKQREISAFDWIFENVEEAIILEDDCLPHPTFFRFCEELLNYYRNDQRIMTISGDNSPLGYKYRTVNNDSYYFSLYPRTWGWATWRRAWQHYDVAMKDWPQIRDENWLEDILGNRRSVKFWRNIFQMTYDGLNTWDYQWILTCWLQNAVTIMPKVNLICNLGFNTEATNTTDSQSLRSNLPTQAIQFPLQHPKFIIRDMQADGFTQKNVYNDPNLLVMASRSANKVFKAFINTRQFKYTDGRLEK